MEEKLNTLLVQGIQNEEGKSRELPADRWNELAEAKDSKEKKKYLYSLKHKFAQILLAPLHLWKVGWSFRHPKKNIFWNFTAKQPCILQNNWNSWRVVYKMEKKNNQNARLHVASSKFSEGQDPNAKIKAIALTLSWAWPLDSLNNVLFCFFQKCFISIYIGRWISKL